MANRKRTSRNKDWIVSGPIHTAVIRLAIPTWLSFLTHDLMGIVDMFFVGKLGASAVAAVGLSSAMIGIVIMLAQGVTVGTTALVASACGRHDAERASEVAGQAVTMALGLSILLAGVGLPLAPGIVRLMGAKGDVISQASIYLRVISGGGFAMLLAISFASALRGAGDAITPLRAMVAANVINIILDPIFIFGLLGMPAMGVAGSAWATMIGRTIGAIIMGHAFFVSERGIIRLHIRSLVPRFEAMKRIAHIGIFSSGRVLVRNVSMLILMRLAATFGTAALAAFGLCLRLQMALFGPTMGFSMAAATVVGQNLGAGQVKRATRAGWTAAGFAVSVAFVLGVAYWLGADLIVPVFNDDEAVIRLGSSFLRWLSPSFVFMALGMVLCFAMNGAGDTLRPMLIAGVSLLLLGVPLAVFLARTWGRVEGIWIAVFCSNVVVGLLSAVVFSRRQWQEVGLRHAAREAESRVVEEE